MTLVRSCHASSNAFQFGFGNTLLQVPNDVRDQAVAGRIIHHFGYQGMGLAQSPSSLRRMQAARAIPKYACGRGSIGDVT